MLMTAAGYRPHPLEKRRQQVERLLDRGVLDVGGKVSKQPGRCCRRAVRCRRRRGLAAPSGRSWRRNEL